MEHRCSERVNTDLKILFYKANVPVAIGRIKNGSKLGFYVETDFSDVNSLQSLDVEIVLSRQSLNTIKHRYTTRVIRKTDNGLGLELESMKLESANALDALLKSPQKHSERHRPLAKPVENRKVVSSKAKLA